MSDLLDRLAVLPQYLWPQRLLTVFAGRFAASRVRWWTRRVIPWFIARYGVDMTEAAIPDAAGYPSFNDFFTRALRDGARPLAAADYVCPVDGAIIQCGMIDGDQLLQVKGHRYSTHALVGGDAALAAQFDDGQYATLYLSPRDYHRIHMPCDGRLVRMIHVPGHLFSVNPTTVRGVPGLFARNERVVCVFESARGPFVMVLVGATIVGSIATVWHGVVNPPRAGTLREWRYDGRAIALRQGAEMGRFLLGSTVILLFPKNTLQLHADWVPGRTVRLGEAMADALARARPAGSVSPSEVGSGLVPLDRIASGVCCVVREMGGGPAFQDRLAGMGLTRGTAIEMLQNAAHGPVLVRAHAARIALGRGEAAKVLVEPVDEPPSAT